VNGKSALYVGSVMHRRLRPRAHRFRYRAFWLLLDLDEIERLPARLALFSYNRFNVFSFHDRDHGDGSNTKLRGQIVRVLGKSGIDLKGGAIRLLCMPRILGHVFNPISIYFCAHADGAPAAIVYEVHNTFGERHSYVIPAQTGGGTLHQSCRKAFYVSPFLDMDMHYDFAVAEPAERLAVAIRASQAGALTLVACLAGQRRAITDGALLRQFFAIPALTLKVVAAIHWEALRLWWKGVRLAERPRRLQPLPMQRPPFPEGHAEDS